MHQGSFQFLAMRVKSILNVVHVLGIEIVLFIVSNSLYDEDEPAKED